MAAVVVVVAAVSGGTVAAAAAAGAGAGGGGAAAGARGVSYGPAVVGAAANAPTYTNQKIGRGVNLLLSLIHHIS